MPRKQSKPTDAWTSLLEKELREFDLPPKGGLSFEEVRALRKERGLPFGGVYVHNWLRAEVAAGRLVKITGHYRKAGSGGRERRVYYIIK